jgi:hypothetical protein
VGAGLGRASLQRALELDRLRVLMPSHAGERVSADIGNTHIIPQNHKNISATAAAKRFCRGLCRPVYLIYDVACLGTANARVMSQINTAISERSVFAKKPAIGKIQMTSFEDLKTTIRRNKLFGMWAAEKLGLVGQNAEAYADALAVGTVDPERSDVFSKIRKDFDVAGVIQSDEQILRVMTELMLQAANQTQGPRGGAPDAAAVMLARNLISR